MSHKNTLEPKDVSFDEESGFTVVKIDKDAYGYDKRAVLLEGRKLEPKDELHITIVSSEAAEIVALRLEAREQDREQIQKLIEEIEWSFRKQDRFYHVREDDQTETIIQMVEVPELERFYQRLGEIVGEELQVPPAHVTLYMRGTEKGIGLPTQQVFDEQVQGQVNLAELEREG